VTQDRHVQYFDAAYTLLAEEGYGGLKLAALCREVGVTTGAFYHFFASWKDFTTRLLDHWQTERTTLLVALARSRTRGIDQLDALMEFSLELPHSAEAAIRVWSSIDPDVAVVQESVDAARFGVVSDAIRQIVPDPTTADRLARLGIMVLIGFEVSDVPKDQHLLEWSLGLIRDAIMARGGPTAGE
jgi:AcrR family transcriptional regulator